MKDINVKAIIFDLDGTLLESMHIWREQPVDYSKIAAAYRDEVVLKPGVFEFLSQARDNGIKMALATATDRKYMLPALHRNKIYDFFEEIDGEKAIFTCHEVGVSKESTAIYDTALRFLNKNNADKIERAETWIFEDAHYAIRTAKRFGCKVAAIEDKWVDLFGDVMPHDELMKTCDLYIADYCAIGIDNLF